MYIFPLKTNCYDLYSRMWSDKGAADTEHNQKCFNNLLLQINIITFSYFFTQKLKNLLKFSCILQLKSLLNLSIYEKT